MKTLIIYLFDIALIILLNNNLLFSQTWPMPGATWEYCITGWNGMPAGSVTLGVTRDTMIYGQLYNIIQPINAGEQSRNENINSFQTLYTRFSNDTIYRYVNDQEYVYFTFNLEIGDVFTTYRTAGHTNFWEDSACVSILPLKVVEESIVEFEGQNFKQFILQDTLFHYLYETNYPEVVEYKLVERIGVTNSYPFINTMEAVDNGSGECILPTDWATVELGKYSDDGFEHTFMECEGEKIKEFFHNNSELYIYPNPTKDYIQINHYSYGCQLFNVMLYNLSGNQLLKTQFRSQLFNNWISLEGFMPGYYLLFIEQLNTPQNIYTTPLIILY